MAAILFAEDDPDVRDIVASALSDAGHQVTEAPDGDIAMQMLTGTEFDLLLTDVRMPGKLNGFALAREARKRWPRMKTVCATGFATEQAREGDCDAFLQKPFSLRTLVQTISRLLKR